MNPQPWTPNGCGGKGGWIRPPQWLLREDCNRHDDDYHRGGTEEDRAAYDDAFYAAMIRTVATRAPWWAKPVMYAEAWIYYRAVRLCGGNPKHFHRVPT